MSRDFDLSKTSASFQKLNQGLYVDIPTNCTRENPKLERDIRPRSLAARQAQETDSGKFHVKLTSFRKRLLDEDNLCGKYHTDLCRYAGVIPGDEPGKTKITISQEKVGSKEEEYTLIEIYRLP